MHMDDQSIVCNSRAALSRLNNNLTLNLSGLAVEVQSTFLALSDTSEPPFRSANKQRYISALLSISTRATYTERGTQHTTLCHQIHFHRPQWPYRLQDTIATTVALSTTEGVCMPIIPAAAHAPWLTQFLRDSTPYTRIEAHSTHYPANPSSTLELGMSTHDTISFATTPRTRCYQRMTVQ